MNIFEKILALTTLVSTLLLNGSQSVGSIYNCYERVDSTEFNPGSTLGTHMCIMANTKSFSEGIFIDIKKSIKKHPLNNNKTVQEFSYKVSNGYKLRNFLRKEESSPLCLKPQGPSEHKLYMKNTQLEQLYCQMTEEDLIDVIASIIPRNPIKLSSDDKVLTPEIPLIMNYLPKQYIYKAFLQIADTHLETAKFYNMLETLADTYCLANVMNESPKNKRVRCNVLVGGMTRDLLRNHMINTLSWVYSRYYHFLYLFSKNPQILQKEELFKIAVLQLFTEYELIQKIVTEFDEIDQYFMDLFYEDTNGQSTSKHTINETINSSSNTGTNGNTNTGTNGNTGNGNGATGTNGNTGTTNPGTTNPTNPGVVGSIINNIQDNSETEIISNQIRPLNGKLLNIKIPITRTNPNITNTSTEYTIPQLFISKSAQEVEQAYKTARNNPEEYINDVLKNIKGIINELKRTLGTSTTTILIPSEVADSSTYVVSNSIIDIRQALFKKKLEYQNLYISYNNLAHELCARKNICMP
ncbi:hypothetical protein NEPAR06_1520 [Nematocida parisii]|nr:hypothetical protein NEPAR07_1493 [Nematocida parisii]KAI5155078.1 hypothetical protein NEPAR06_1520 [Nematocida parisii]KAI5157739.1 hypothetical protein NEPAR05_1546 [Nematocida parisii]